LHKQRGVGFADFQDGSIQYRQMMWRDGVRLLRESPRNLIYGVGMDSIKTHWSQWGLFDKGWQPMGHFHSTPIQIAVERGLPALLLWLAVLAVYARSLWRGIRRARGGDWAVFGVLLGCFGGLIGFFAGGFVHYNLGDTEVAMIFYFLMGISVRLSEIVQTEDTR
jgi:O-antigen ligase